VSKTVDAATQAAPALERGQRRRIRAAGFLASLIMLALLTLLKGNERLGNVTFDAYQRLHPRDLAAMKVKAVDIDAASLHAIGSWPWSRYDLARLTELLVKKGHVAAIGFDMVFPEEDRQAPARFAERYATDLPPATLAQLRALPSMDKSFADVIGASPVVLARAGVTARESDFIEPIYKDAAQLPVEASFTAPLPPTVEHWPQALSSIPAIEEVGHGYGLVNGEPDPDGIVRHVPAVGLVNGAANAGFALELARVGQGLDALTPIVARDALHGVRLGTRTIPVRTDGRFLLHFGRWPAGGASSAADVFRRGYDLSSLAGKIVIVGLTSGGSTDVVTTPLSARDFGPHIQAQAVDAILRGGWLERPAWALVAEDAAGLLLALVVILWFPRLDGIAAYAVPVALALIVLAVSAAAFLLLALLLDPLRPLLIAGAAAAATFVGLLAETMATQRRLREALHTQQLAAARTAGEMEAAREIQLGMLQPRENLARIAPGVDVDALLEPARRVGGDFYDAFALDDGRVAFLVGDVSGKGVDAALFMALSKALAESAIRQAAGDLARTIALLVADLGRHNAADMFVTMLIGVLDVTSGALALFSAGHENPFLLRADGRIEELVIEGGPPIGTADDFPYDVEHKTLAPGEGLVVITDGIVDAQAVDGRSFDRAGVELVLTRLGDGWLARGAVDALRSAVRAFEDGADPYDDLTILALRRTPA